MEASAALLIQPALQLGRELGLPGSVTTATGTGFPAGDVTLGWGSGIGSARTQVDDRGRLRAQVLVFPHDIEGPRELLVETPAAPELAALRVPFLVVSGAAEPGSFVERD